MSLRIIRVSGSSYARGLSQGRQLAPLIQRHISDWTTSLCAMHNLESPDAYLGAFLAETDYLKSIEKFCPGLLDEVRGIAEGSGLNFEHVLAWNLLDEEWSFGKQVGLKFIIYHFHSNRV